MHEPHIKASKMKMLSHNKFHFIVFILLRPILNYILLEMQRKRETKNRKGIMDITINGIF